MLLRVPPLLLKCQLRCQSQLATSYLPTIYALSTAPGTKSAIAVVRVSGTHSKYIYHRLNNSEKKLIPRRTLLRNLYATDKNLLDKALTLFFDSPKSYTGEDLLELHLHGGKAVTSSVLNAIGSLNDRNSGIEIRYALPGEFTQRAFQNGKIDLTEVEGIRELIDAETETQRQCALSSFNGMNKNLFMFWRDKIINNIAQLTAIIDFGEDTEIEDTNNILQLVKENMVQLKEEINQFIQKVEKTSILQSGIKVVLLGPPNAGKSSLINSISSDDVSIISQTPGTTRDAVETSIDVNGYKVTISDTAGIRSHSSDEIELLGIERTIKKSEQCDLCLLIVDPSSKPLINENLTQMIQSMQTRGKEFIIIVNKQDLLTNENHLKSVIGSLKEKLGDQFPIITVSCKTQEGIESLIKQLTKIFQRLSETTDDSSPIIASRRVKEILHSDVLYGINSFFVTTNTGVGDDAYDVVMASEHLSHAADGIGKITGDAVGIEEILGVVFAKFCVGK